MLRSILKLLTIIVLLFAPTAIIPTTTSYAADSSAPRPLAATTSAGSLSASYRHTDGIRPDSPILSGGITGPAKACRLLAP